VVHVAMIIREKMIPDRFGKAVLMSKSPRFDRCLLTGFWFLGGRSGLD
jgi:hypothetical protein